MSRMDDSDSLRTAREEGREEGKQQTALAITKNMVAGGMDLRTISAITGFSLEEIKRLTSQIFIE